MPTLLLTVTGPDRPGVTSALFDVLTPLGAEVLDVEQVVIRGNLVLGLLVTVDLPASVLRVRLDLVTSPLGIAVQVSEAEPPTDSPDTGRHHVTVLGQPLTAAGFGAVVRRLATVGANIDRIERLSSFPLTSFELLVSGADPARLRAELAAEAAASGVDVAVQPASLYRRATRLVCLDVDSTLVQGEVIEMLAERAGSAAATRVAEVTDAAMRGQLDFEASLRARVALLAGLPASALEEVAASVQLQRGAQTLIRTLRRVGYVTAVVSGGFTQITDTLVERLGIDHSAANTLEVVDGRLTGQLVGLVVDRAGKAAALRRFADAAGIPLSQTVAVGDGANDLDMLAAAGLGIAFNAKPLVREHADAALSAPYLDAVLFMLGISRADVEAADAAAEANPGSGDVAP